jgi:spore coat protein U-like protein
MIPVRRFLALVSGPAVLAIAGAAHAQTTQTTTGNLRVQATVLSQCAVQDATLDFGQVDSIPRAAQPPQTDIRVTCTLGVPYTVGIGNGENASSGQRRMLRQGSTGAQSGDYLNYDLYKEIGLVNRWGDAIVSERISGTGTGATQTAPVFGKLVASTPASGNFVDNAVITLYY